MTPKENGQGASPTATSSPDEQQLLEQTIDGLFDDVSEAPGLLRQELKKLDGPEGGGRSEAYRSTLRNMENLFRALNIVDTDQDYEGARGLLDAAVDGFSSCGQPELSQLASGLAVYYHSTTELRKMNIALAQELIAKAIERIEGAGKYGERFEPLVAEAEMNILYISALTSLQQLDYDTAKALFEQAAQAGEKLAKKFFKPDSPGYNTYLGMAHYYRAFSNFVRAFNRFNLFRFTEVGDEVDASRDARRAGELIRKGNEYALAVGYLSDALALLSEVIMKLSRAMEEVFRSTIKPDTAGYSLLRKKLDEAADLLSKTGKFGVTSLRMCEEIRQRLNNIERLAQPTKKDFGRFSGIVTAVSFLPLFLLSSWANSRFGLGVEAAKLIWYCVVLSLIAGFGLSALKFRTWLAGG